MNKSLTQWHPAFCSAIRLELVANKSDLTYQSEVGLNTKPILIDLLVIMKSPDIIIEKSIGKFFRGHNIFEYKSPRDSLDIDTIYKGIAYASLYKSNSQTVDGIRAEDITISFVRESKPTGLFKKLQSQGISIEKKANGVYYIGDRFIFDIQIIVSGELDKQEYIWLTSLTDSISLEEARSLVINASRLTAKDDIEFSESVLQVVMSKNSKAFKKVKEVPEVCEALAQLMKPEMDKMLNEKISEILNEKETEIAQRDTEIAQKREQIAQKDTEIAQKDTEIAQKETEIAQKETEIAQKDTEIAQKETEIAQRDEEIARKDAEIAQLKAQLAAQ